MPRSRKTGKRVAIGSMCVTIDRNIDGSGDSYDIISSEEVRHLPFLPLVRGSSCTESCTLFVWDIFEDPSSSRVATYMSVWVMSLIVLSAFVGACVETNPPIHKEQEDVWFAIETFFIANFSIEFLLRLLCCPECKQFWSSGMNYVDLIAILPYYLKLLLGGGANVGFLRVLRLGRAFRLVKMGRYSQGIRLVTNALSKSVDALQLFGFLLVLVLVVFSSGEYYFERGSWDEDTRKYYRDNPETGNRETSPSPFQSIPESMWWCIVTLTTVGYGDMYPYTVTGKVFAVVTMLVGLIMLALPLSIIGTNFIEERNIMNAENEEEQEPADPAPLLTDLHYCLTRAKLLREVVGTVSDKVGQAEAVLEQIDKQVVGEPEATPELDPEEGMHVPHTSKTKFSVSKSQLDQLFKLQSEVLVSCMIQKDVWDEHGSGVNNLPVEVRDLIIPMLEGQVAM